MKEFTISVSIADRAYRLKVNSDEEEYVRKATKMIDEQIKEYSQHFAYNDKQDLLAMSALHFALSSLRCDEEGASIRGQLDDRIDELESMVSEHLK
jgi:cell division protein ZapA